LFSLKGILPEKEDIIMEKNDKKAKKGVIEVTENGPFLVKGLDKFKNKEGEDILSKEVMPLCRCGQSEEKPFCDGTHFKVGFSGEKDPSRQKDKIHRYRGKNITIYDNRGVCAHRGYCTEDVPTVFDVSKKRWINPDGAPVEDIIALCNKCPSGALSYSLPGEERVQCVEENPEQVKIAPRRHDADGPYDITGAVELKDHADCCPESEEHYCLCRCGASKNKPFCSGEHWHIKFRDY